MKYVAARLGFGFLSLAVFLFLMYVLIEARSLG